MKETQEQQDRRLAHADSLPKELVELETEFADEWLKDHDFTPTFADAIGWARDKQRAELIDKACEWIEKHGEDYMWVDPLAIDTETEGFEGKEMAEDFRKAMAKED